MIDLLGTLLEYILAAGFLLLVFWIVGIMNRRRYDAGSLTGPTTGQTYVYVIGDKLHYGYAQGMFSGIDIVMPAVLPNIYLDGHHGRKGQGTRHYFPGDQRLSLEGDFNAYFNCYAPDGYGQLALTILTPDIMRTLIEAVPGADVEIRMDHIRVIVDQKIFGRPELTGPLVSAAEMVLAQIDQKLQSWTQADSEESAGALLNVQTVAMHRFLGHYYRTSTLVLGPIYALVGILVWIICLSTGFQQNNNTATGFDWLFQTFMLPFLFFPCLFVILLAVIPSRRFEAFLDRLQ